MNSFVIRRRYVLLGGFAIVLGLTVHLHGLRLPASARDIVGDALWAMMVACIFSAIRPFAGATVRYIAALITCFLVELSQLWHTPVLDGSRATPIGRLVLGSGFDRRDFGAYALGILAFVMFDRLWIRRARSREP